MTRAGALQRPNKWIATILTVKIEAQLIDS